MENSGATKYVISILLLLSLLQSNYVSASSNNELITNGGFEKLFNGWQTYTVNDMYGRVNLTSGTSHSGEFSLRTYAIPLRKSPYTLKRGGGAIQTISTDVNELDMKLSFWTKSSIIGENDYTNSRSIINIELKDGRKLNVSYYVAWAPRIVNEPTHNSSNNLVYIVYTKLNQWSHIQRSITNDLAPIYAHSSNLKISKISVIFETITISNMLSHDTFWDDISITYETSKVVETTSIETLSQETTTTQMPTPTITQTATPTPNPIQETEQFTHFNLNTLGMVTIGIIVAAALLLIKKRKTQTTLS